VLHGLAAVYIEPLDKWIRLDPRGNKPGISAEFSIEYEQIAYEPVSEGEWLDQHIYPEPWQDVSHLVELSMNVPEFIENSGKIHIPPITQERIQIMKSSCSS
jgi:transglutaminase-like putative cysteine protease